MKTQYRGSAMIDLLRADVEIVNVDVVRWKGTVTSPNGIDGPIPTEAIVTLLEQPRPGWSACAEAIESADGVVHLEGRGRFYPPRSASPGPRSLWVRRSSGT